MTENLQPELSERELEILRLVATGASNKEIAYNLSISANTVKVHLRNIFGKIGVASRTEAAMYAVKMGEVSSVSTEEIVVTEQDDSPDVATDDSLVVQEPRFSKRLWVSVIAFAVLIVPAIVFLFSRLRSENRTDGILAKTDVFPTPMLERWVKLADMPTGRAGLAAVVYDEQIYAIAGEAENGVTGVVERYDPVNDRWTSCSPKPIAVADIGAVVIGGMIYVPGGRLESGVVTSTMEIYDPLRDSWSVGQSLPRKLSAYAITAYEGKLYVFGGWDGGIYVDTVYQYDPISAVWRERTPMPTAEGYAGAAIVSGKIYVLGGKDGNNMNVLQGYAYLPELDGSITPWEDKTILQADGRYAAGITSVTDVIYVAGGKASGEIPCCLQYRPQQETWAAFEAPFTELGARLSLVNLGAHLYVLGGELDEGITANNLRYKAVYTIVLPVGVPVP